MHRALGARESGAISSIRPPDSKGRGPAPREKRGAAGVGGPPRTPVIPTGRGDLVMNATSMKRALGLTAAAVSASGAMMLAPTVANAATAHPAHVQTVSNVSSPSCGWGGWPGWGGWGGWPGWGGWGGWGGWHHHHHHCCCWWW
jgi:hypothetical protein